LNLPLGYAYAATYSGIRQVEKDDLALIVTGLPASAAGVFTQNRVQASPVKLCRRHLKLSGGMVGAILVNAGNANCATRTGDKVALATSRALAKLLKVPAPQVLPSSTGVIGVELNPALITDALPALVEGLSTDRFNDAADAILTTDTVSKTACVEQAGFRVAGLTKGSGMIHPNMATTLAFVVTDAAIAPAELQRALRQAVALSYNRLSVDGDMSTNDTLLVLANGASGVRIRALNRAQFQRARSLAARSRAGLDRVYPFISPHRLDLDIRLPLGRLNPPPEAPEPASCSSRRPPRRRPGAAGTGPRPAAAIPGPCVATDGGRTPGGPARAPPRRGRRFRSRRRSSARDVWD